MPDQDKSFISTMMHPVKGVGCVLMQEEKVEAYARKHEMKHLTYDLELSIMEHGSAIFWGIKVTSKWITRI